MGEYRSRRGYPIHSKYLFHIAILTRLALSIQPKDLGGQLTVLPQTIAEDAAIAYSDGMTLVAFHVRGLRAFLLYLTVTPGSFFLVDGI